LVCLGVFSCLGDFGKSQRRQGCTKVIASGGTGAEREKAISCLRSTSPWYYKATSCLPRSVVGCGGGSEFTKCPHVSARIGGTCCLTSTSFGNRPFGYLRSDITPDAEEGPLGGSGPSCLLPTVRSDGRAQLPVLWHLSESTTPRDAPLRPCRSWLEVKTLGTVVRSTRDHKDMA